MFGHVYRHVDMCVDMRIDVCMDMCADMYVKMCVGMCVDTGVGMCTDMCKGMSVEMRAHMPMHAVAGTAPHICGRPVRVAELLFGSISASPTACLVHVCRRAGFLPFASTDPDGSVGKPQGTESPDQHNPSACTEVFRGKAAFVYAELDAAVGRPVDVL